MPWLRVTTSASPEFDSLVRQTLGPDLADQLADVLPYSIVVTNESSGPLIGIAVRFEVKTAERTVTRDYFYFNFPQLMRPVFAAGDSRVFTPLGNAYELARRHSVDASALSMLAASDAIHAAIELAIAPDGRTAGADRTRSLAQMSDQVQGFHTMIDECHARLTRGASNAELESWLEEVERTPRAGTPHDRLASMQRAIASSWLELLRSGRRDKLVTDVEQTASMEDKTLTFLASVKPGELK